MKKCYEEYSEDKKRRFLIYDDSEFFSVVVEQYQEEFDVQGYIEPAGFYEEHDTMIHHVGTIEEGIRLGKELLRNK